MSFTTGTPNFGLPQYKGTDMPSWQTDITNAFKKIDEVMGDVGSESSGAVTDVENLKTEVNTLKTTSNQTVQNLETLTTTVNTNQTNNQQALNALDTRVTLEHNTNVTQTEAINQMQSQLENIPDADTLANLANDVSSLKIVVGDTPLEDGETLTGSVVKLGTEVGIETRVNPDDPTKAQWRAKGSTSEQDWVNFKGGEAIRIGSLTSSSPSIQNDLLIGKNEKDNIIYEKGTFQVEYRGGGDGMTKRNVTLPSINPTFDAVNGEITIAENALSNTATQGNSTVTASLTEIYVWYVESKTT